MPEKLPGAEGTLGLIILPSAVAAVLGIGLHFGTGISTGAMIAATVPATAVGLVHACAHLAAVLYRAGSIARIRRAALGGQIGVADAVALIQADMFPPARAGAPGGPARPAAAILPQARSARPRRASGVGGTGHRAGRRLSGTGLAAAETAGAAVLPSPVAGADALLRLVRDGGLFVGMQPGAEPAEKRGVTVRVVVARPDGTRLAPLLDATASGRLPARVHAVVPLDQAATAHRAVAKGGVRGRYVLQP